MRGCGIPCSISDAIFYPGRDFGLDLIIVGETCQGKKNLRCHLAFDGGNATRMRFVWYCDVLLLFGGPGWLGIARTDVDFFAAFF